MPYITKQARNDLAEGVNPATVGELNYSITVACTAHLREAGSHYQVFNDIVGTIELAKNTLQAWWGCADLEREPLFDLSESTLDRLHAFIVGRVVEWIRSESVDGFMIIDDIIAALGVLECAKLEFYRRAVVPYEDSKVLENGDVY